MRPLVGKCHLLVTFTYGVSLKEWGDSGLVDRELLLYKRMVQAGHQVTLMTYGDETDLAFTDRLDGIEILPVYARDPGGARSIKKRKNRWANLFFSFWIPFHFRRYFKSADILKTNQMSGSWVAAMASILYQKPLVVRCGFEMLRNMLRDEPYLGKRLITTLFGYLAELFSFVAADRIIISSQTDLRFIQRRYPVRSKIRVIRNFIDTDTFQPLVNIVGPSKKESRILFVGRLAECKNILNLIKAVPKTDTGLDIVGKGPLENQCRKHAETFHADIRFLGVLQNREMPRIMNRYEIVILPSLFECSPKGLLEAMACGRVVIGADVSGIRELIHHGVTGFLCGTDSGSLAEAINRAMRLTDDQKREMGGRARAFVQRECALEKVFQKEKEIYQDILKIRVF